MEKLYTPEMIALEITKEKLAEIKNEGSKINYRTTNHSCIRYDYRYLIQRAEEIAFKGGKHKDESLLFKNLLAANIVFPNDLKFADIINNNGLTIEELNLVNDRTSSHAEKLTILLKLAKIFKQHYGVIMTTLIVNKINELIVFNPELLNIGPVKRKLTE